MCAELGLGLDSIMLLKCFCGFLSVLEHYKQTTHFYSRMWTYSLRHFILPSDKHSFSNLATEINQKI